MVVLALAACARSAETVDLHADARPEADASAEVASTMADAGAVDGTEGPVASVPGPPAPASRSGSSDCRAGRWIDRTPSPRPAGWPSARSSFGLAYDGKRGVVLLEGGVPVSRAQETMEWSGARGTWTNRTRYDAFGPRLDHVLVYDSGRDRMLAWGGMARINGESLADGPWEWRASTGQWTNLGGKEGPGGRGNSAAAYDRARDRLVLLGGFIANDTWEWLGEGGWQRPVTPSPDPTGPLTGHGLVYDTHRDQLYALGGRNLGGVIYRWQDGWVAVPTAGGPLPREWMAVAYDETRDRVMVFGGVSPSNNFRETSDLWEWDPATGAWTLCSVTPAPPTRLHAAMVYDSARQSLVLFGGVTYARDEHDLADLWEWYVP